MDSYLRHFYYKLTNKISGRIICVSDCYSYDEEEFYKNHPASFRSEYIIISKEEYDSLKPVHM